MIIPSDHAGCPANPRPSLTVDVPRQTSFYVPADSYSAAIRSVSIRSRQNSRASIPFVHLLFTVNVPGADVEYLAKIDFKLDLNEGSDLWNILCRLIGQKRLQDCSGKQFDLQSLVGLACDLEIGHVHDDAEDYPYPLVVILDIQPAGRLVKPEVQASGNAQTK